MNCSYCHDRGGLTLAGKIVARCKHCCKHEHGFQVLNQSFGANAGKLLCKEWCGFMKTGRVPLVKKE